MALQRVPGELIVSAFSPTVDSVGISASTLDAAGESCALIAYVALEGGNAATKTISSAGGQIYWRSGNPITFANAGSNLRIGLQDVATTGLEDGTFDVYADLVGGTDAIAASTWFKTAMETNTKTLTHGQLIAVCFELTARGGADSVLIARAGGTSGVGATSTTLIPYGTADAGTLAKGTAFPFAFLEFDDGTTGWLMGVGLTTMAAAARVTYGSTSTPDEYAAIFTPPFTCEIDGMGADISDIDSGDTFELILYTDPLGTPSATVTLTPDEDQTAAAAGGRTYSLFGITPTTLTAGVTYGVALRPTSAATVSFGYVDFTTGLEKMKRAALFGSTLKIASRTNVTGAFTEVQTYHCPGLFLRISKLDDGVGAGGGGLLVHPGMAGGMRAYRKARKEIYQRMAPYAPSRQVKRDLQRWSKS